MVTENLQAELEQVVAEKKQLAEDRVKYNAKMSEAAERSQRFLLVKKLAEEIPRVKRRSKSQSAKMEKLEKFRDLAQLAEEIGEFQRQKRRCGN